MSDQIVLLEAVMQALNAVVITDADLASGCKVIFANPAFCKMTGYSEEELLGRSLKMLQGAETDPAVIAELRSSLAEARYFEGTTKNYRKDGSDYIVRWNISPVRSADGAVSRFVSVQQDITSLVKSEERNRLLATALNSASDPIYITDTDSKIVFTNLAFIRLAGLSAAEILGSSPENLRICENYEGNANIKLYRNHSGAASEDFGDRRRGDDVVYIKESRTPMLDEKGEPSHWVAVGKDISRRIKVENSLKISASRDKLTGLYNRDFGQKYLDNAHDMALANNEHLSIIMCDIDHFKSVNDTYGHSTGDKVIKLVAHTLRQAVRSEDAVIRWGGEEFLIVLNECPFDPAVKLAERIRHNVESCHNPARPAVSVSLGVATLGSEESISQLIDRADSALYESKRNGRNRVSAAPPMVGVGRKGEVA